MGETEVGVEGRSEGEDIFIHRADSLHCIAETNTTLSNNKYTNKSF